MDQRAGGAHEPHHQDAAPKRFHYDSYNQLRRHLQDFIDAYNFDRRLKILRGLTPYEFICERRTWSRIASSLIRSIKCRD